ncbi:HlyD family efflux transporter periplasmic adaptor subunit [Sulfurimonas paralvinellae]|uniref:HlyD family secretion protein n=1 Tax=Sulfurimonas paralvinellae TaxID=317658 RepID=A0A7M1B8A9_9BACT|nr:HlyD family efflux transporter periplasmic adaptor subunit [Sulfurimonas paralvinellae]QOP45960.1 HlyD family secretion protein [Sulfurimonas paralvinellae]
MRILFYLILSTLLVAEVHYSKVEPYKFKNISSNVTGEILFVDENLIGKRLSSKPFIIIDAEIDNAELVDIKKKMQHLQETLLINEKILKNLEAVLEKKRLNYKKTEALKIKSRIDKDREFYDLVASENSYNATQKEIYSLKNSLADLQLRRIQLEKSIRDKKVTQKGFVLYSVAVKEGQVVNMATPLAQVADISKGLLSIYVDADELQNIQNKVVYINGKKTSYRVSRVLDIADSVNISKYKVQIVIDPPKVFSKLVKVDLREE